MHLINKWWPNNLNVRKTINEMFVENLFYAFFILHSQLAKMVSKYFQEQEQKEQKAEEEEGKKLKKIASQIAKHVKEFWSNIEKVYKFYCLFCNKKCRQFDKK